MRQRSGTYVPIGDEGVHEGEVDHYPDDLAEQTPRDPLADIVNGLRASFQATVSLGRSVDKLAESHRKIWERLQRNTPVYYPVAASGVAATGQPLILNLGSPDQGTRWEVTQVAIGGTDYNVTAAGSAGLYIAGNTLARGMLNLADFAPVLPNQATYGHDQIMVNDQEFLFVTIDGGTNLQTYVANASVTVWNVATGGGTAEIAV